MLFRSRRGKVHRCAVNVSELSQRNLTVVGREPAARDELQDVVESRSRAVAVEIEICVVGQIDHCRSVGGCFESEGQAVVVVPAVTGADFHVAWIALFAVGRRALENYCVAVGPTLPVAVMEAGRATVEGVLHTLPEWDEGLSQDVREGLT